MHGRLKFVGLLLIALLFDSALFKLTPAHSDEPGGPGWSPPPVPPPTLDEQIQPIKVPDQENQENRENRRNRENRENRENRRNRENRERTSPKPEEPPPSIKIPHSENQERNPVRIKPPKKSEPDWSPPVPPPVPREQSPTLHPNYETPRLKPPKKTEPTYTFPTYTEPASTSPTDDRPSSDPYAALKAQCLEAQKQYQQLINSANSADIYAQLSQVETFLIQAFDILAAAPANCSDVSIACEPSVQALYYRLANAQVQQGKLDPAFENYQKSNLLTNRTHNAGATAQGLTPTRQTALDEIDAFVGLGGIYLVRGDIGQAIQLYQRALQAAEAIGDSRHRAIALTALGTAYIQQRQFGAAVKVLEAAIDIARTNGYRLEEATALVRLAMAYRGQGQYLKALDLAYQALAIQQSPGDRRGESFTYSLIGYLLADLNYPELAIVFLKHYVNLTEAYPNSALPPFSHLLSEDSATYRQLADLLLRQNRAAEAQEVMDLMSIQEAQEFLGETSATRQRLQLQPPEQTILDEFQNFVQSMRELEQLQQIPEDKRTSEQTQRISELEAEKSKKARGFNRFRAGVDIDLQRLLRKDPEAISLNLLNNFQCFLPQPTSQRQLQQNVAVLRPLVLNDRLELVLTIPAIRSLPPRNYPIPVPATVLNQEINTFRQALVTRDPRVKQSAQKLYQRLIQPIESTLQQAGVKTIVYGADEKLRYVPLAALHDGKQWLVQKYRTFSIINSSLANCNAPTRARTNILAGAGTFQTPVGLKQDTPTPLPFAKQEVETIAALFPQTTTLIDHRFSRENTRQLMNQYNILHFATHAAFFPRNPKDSYILFGNGDRDTLNDISQWNLQNTDLIVLSACETAVSGELGDGREILGFGYQVHQRGAKTALSSLWQIDDAGTQVFMGHFYAALKRGLSRAEALHRAQIALLTSAVQPQNANVTSRSSFTDPYYWAPFVLVGNGL